MNRDVILKSWNFVNNDSKIKKFYFLHGLLSILFLTVVLVYQTIYTYVELFHQQDKAAKIILNFFHSGYLFEFILFGGIFFLAYIMIMPLLEGTLISYISQKNKNLEGKVSIKENFSYGLYGFLPLFEYGNLFAQFKFMSVLNIYLFCLRFFGIQYFSFLNWILLALLFISTVVNILFAYGKFEIILNNSKASKAMSTSIKISILNLIPTIKIYFFLFLLNIRIIINFVVFLSFPLLIASLISIITTKLYLIITIGFLGIIFFIMIIFLGYLGGVFEVLKTTIWYHSYEIGKQKLSHIEKDEK